MAEPPIIDYGTAPKRREFMRLTLPEWLTILGIIALLVSILVPSLRRAREKCCNIPCASHLRQIGQAIQLYALDNGGAFPPDLPTVLLTQQISPEAFVCPSSSDKPAKGRTPQEQAAQLHNGHCSYIYVGRHLNEKSNPECIVAFEDPANHGLEGSNIVFADGHVEFLQLHYIAPLISELEQGHNPPHSTELLTKQRLLALYQRDWVPKLPAIKSGQWSASLPATRPATQPAR